MASRRILLLQFFAAVFIATSLESASFVPVGAADSKSEEKAPKDVSSPEDSSSQEDSKEKRSQEEIMFGNQQNKPNGLVDDLMEMSDNAQEEDTVPDKKSTDPQGDDQPSDDAPKEEKLEDKRTQDEDMMMGSGSENWYNTIPVSTKAMQYLANSPAIKTLPQDDYPNSLYDQEDLYRRKRQLFAPLQAPPLYRRKRNLLPMPLRSSLGQMIQKRGIRLPRRSMRLKRQVDVEDLINLIGNERYYEDEPQMTPHIFGGRSQSVAKRRVPGRFSNYPETPAPEFRIPYVFQHRDDGMLTSPNSNSNMEESNDAMEDGNMEDINDLMLMPPNSRFSDVVQQTYSNPRDDEKEAFQKWLALHTIPSVLRVQRRSSPFFYPIDYRYIPGYKKRSIFSHGNRGGDVARLSSSDDSEGNEFGKWGHVVQVPEAYASPEDIARLYGLAGLLAEGDEAGDKKRRAA